LGQLVRRLKMPGTDFQHSKQAGTFFPLYGEGLSEGLLRTAAKIYARSLRPISPSTAADERLKEEMHRPLWELVSELSAENRDGKTAGYFADTSVLCLRYPRLMASIRRRLRNRDGRKWLPSDFAIAR
jgi:hypothetical protein